MSNAKLFFVILAMLGGIAFSPDGFEDAKKALDDAILKDSADAQKTATQQIVDLGDARGLGALNGALISAIPNLRKAENELEQLESEVERRKEKIERLKVSPDERVKAEGKKAEVELKEFTDKKVAPLRKRAGNFRATRDIVSKGLTDLIAKLPPEKRHAEVDRLAKTVADAAKTSWDSRVAAMECYARMGDSGAFAVMWKVCKESLKDKKKLIAELPEKEAAFEKERARFYEIAKKQGNVVARGADELMNKLGGEVKAQQEKIYAQSQLVEASSRLIPLAISGLASSAQSKPIAELTTAVKGNDAPARLAAIEILAGISDDGVRVFLRSLLAGGDPSVRVAAIDALVKQKDDGAIDTILEKCIKDEEWTVRAAAIQALASIRSAKSVPSLIAAFENEVGRLRDDAQDALESLTGLNMNTPALWKQWWEKSRDGFNPAPPSSQPAKKGPRPGDTGVAFAGIQSNSKNIAFVVDVSGSMNFGLESDGPPADGKPTRFEMLKKELLQAIEHLPDGGKYLLLTFSTGVNQVTPKVETMNKDSRKKVLDYVQNEMKPEGGTNIYAALKGAFDAAGMGATDKYYRPAIDTIYFLTDGTPSPDTEITDPERLLAYVRERNKLGKITINVVCLGEADASFLRKLAEQNKGEFVKP